MRISVVTGLAAVLSIYAPMAAAQTSDEDPIIVAGECAPESHIAKGAIGEDLTKRQSRFFCDSAVVTIFGENRFPKHVMIQFASKHDHGAQIGYAGQMNDKNTLNVVNVYLETGQLPSKASDGACKFFYEMDVLSSVTCGAKIDESGRRTVPIVVFSTGLPGNISTVPQKATSGSMMYSAFLCLNYAGAPQLNNCQILKVNGAPIYYQDIDACKSMVATLNGKAPVKGWICMAKPSPPGWHPAR